MTSLQKAFLKDKNGNLVWAKAHITSVYDDENTPLSTILDNYEGGGYVPTLNAAPTSSTITYTKDGETKNYVIGLFCRIVDANEQSGYKFYLLKNLVTVSDTTTATWEAKPNYDYNEINYEIATLTTSGAVTINGTKPLHIVTLSGAATSVVFSTGNLPVVGHSCHIIFTAASDTTVSIAHVSTGTVRYICPGGESPEDLEVPAGGYVEINLLRGTDTEENDETISWIYVRGV